MRTFRTVTICVPINLRPQERSQIGPREPRVLGYAASWTTALSEVLCVCIKELRIVKGAECQLYRPKLTESCAEPIECSWISLATRPGAVSAPAAILSTSSA
jgi:hypothetical protein